MYRILTAFIAVLGLTIGQLAAQSTPSNSSSDAIATVSEKTIANDAFFTADDEHTIYVDFEQLNVNLSDIIVRDELGKVILEDNVFDLPVNTIYELDFSKYTPGQYEIELRTFTGSIRKSIAIR